MGCTWRGRGWGEVKDQEEKERLLSQTSPAALDPCFFFKDLWCFGAPQGAPEVRSLKGPEYVFVDKKTKNLTTFPKLADVQ
jgi:hypothetical protein